MPGKLEVTYEFPLRGIEVRPLDFNVPRLHLTAKLTPGTFVRLDVTVDETEDAPGRSLAQRFADEVYQRILLKFGGGIDSSWAPRPGRTVYTGRDGQLAVAHAIPIAIDSALTADATIKLSQQDLDNMAREVELRMITPQLAVHSDLYTAIDMYSVSFESDNTVVRYLVLYSAVALAALFKFGSGTQERIDHLLSTVEPTLPRTPSPHNPSQTETLFTRLRNELIHAESRGKDPAQAIAQINTHVRDFQALVTRVMASL